MTDPTDMLQDTLVERILKSRGGRRLLEMDERAMRVFLSSAESTVTLRSDVETSVEERVIERTKTRADLACDLYLDAAGVTMLAVSGATAILEERGYVVHACGGASSGALVAALIAGGYTAAEVREVLLTADFSRLFAHRGRTRPFSNRAPYELRFCHDWLSDLLAAKGIRTFRDLRLSDRDLPGFRLVVVVTEFSQRRLIVLPSDAAVLGLEPDAFTVADAVVASMSWPGLFDPISHENPVTGERHDLVDGRFLPTFPMWMFDVSDGMPRYPTFGVRVTSNMGPLGPTPAKPGDAESVAAVELESRSRLAIDDASLVRTIMVPVDDIALTDFTLSSPQALELYDRGRRAADGFLAAWDFEAYLATYRAKRT